MTFYADDHNITAIVGGLSWESTLTELAVTMDFEIAKLTAQHTNIYVPVCGSIVRLVTNIEIFRGIVVSVDDGGQNSNKYTAVDFGFYLNKSKECYQFSDTPAAGVLDALCSNAGIPVDSICPIDCTISKIYLDSTVADILKDVLETAEGVTGYAYNFDVTPQGLRVYRLGDLGAWPEVRLSGNTPLLYSPDLRGGVGHSISIEELKNSVRVVSGDENAFTVLATAKDEALIAKYGLLQEIEKVDAEKSGNAAALAASKLKRLAREKETFSFEIIEAEDSYTRAGSELYVDGALYIIEGAAHTLSNGIHKVKLDLRRV